MFSFKNGKLTINSAIYLTHILISFIMGITAPVTVKYFTSHELVTTAVINVTAVACTLAGSFLAWSCTSTKMLDWMTRRFVAISVAIDVVLLLIAIFGADHPVERFFIYKIIGIVGIDILRKVQKRNINLSMANDGDRLSVFNNTREYYAKCAAVSGGLIGLFIYFTRYELDVVTAMFAEFSVCLVAHILQIYANHRIQKEVLHTDIKQTFIDALNHCFTTHEEKDNEFKSEDPFDR